MISRQLDFARFYEEHVWSVYAFLAYRVRSREAAEDLTQATFERALRAWSRFDRRKGSERAWLFAIATNLLIDHHRGGRRQALEPFDERSEAAVPGPAERFAASPELEQALSQLSNREREVLALRYGADLSGQEVADLLGMTLANVQQIASRSLRKLRQLLAVPHSTPTPSTMPNAIRSVAKDK
jgi:RNA polymerase sigma-70 factor (ECF subfamily)